MAKVPCFNDANCSGTLVCYVEPGWAPPGSPKKFCDCESWYGTTGEDCSLMGTGTIVSLTIQSLILLCNLGGLLAAIMVTRDLLRLSPLHRVQHIVAISMGIILCFTLAVGASFFCVELAIWLTPEEHLLLEESSTLEGTAKVHSFLFVERTAFQVFASFIALGGLSLPIAWVERFAWSPGVDSSRVMVETHGYEIACLVLDVVFIVFSAAFVLGETTLLYNVFMLSLVVSAGIIYVGLPRKLFRIVSDLGEVDDRLLVVVNDLKRARMVTLIGTVVFAMGAVATLFTLATYRNFDEPGQFALGWFLYTILNIGMEIVTFSFLYYIWKVQQNSETSELDHPIFNKPRGGDI